VALSAAVASGLLYPGGTVLDESTRGYSLTHNFLSDLGSTVAFNYAGNTAGALLFAVAVVVAVGVLAGSFVAAVRLLSASPPARPFARLAAAAGALVCVGYLGAALTPLDRAFGLHMLSTVLAVRSFPVATALLAVATWRDGRFGVRATLGWGMLTIVLIGHIVMVRLGPGPATERGLVTQVITQKIMAATVLLVLWIESREAERASERAVPVLPNESLQLTESRSSPAADTAPTPRLRS
jgi:hypothetical protein